MSRSTAPLDPSSTNRLALPAPLSRNNSHTSQHSIHSQRSHSSQTHHVSPSDPTTLANLLPSMITGEEADSAGHSASNHVHHPRHTTHPHSQHTNLFVAQDGPTGMPSFEELVITEQRDSMECDIEDADGDEQAVESKAKRDAETQPSQRRRSVAFLEESSAKQAVRQRHGDAKSSTSSKSTNLPKGSSPSSSSSSSSSKTLSSQKGNPVEASETDPLLPSKQDAKANEPGDDLDYDPTKDPEEWARIREGSIARRSRWRRPGPYW
jgi:hypothetical protein